MNTLKTLIAARAVIAKPETWTQKAIARDASGRAMSDLYSPQAVSFCAIGALLKVNGRNADFEPAVTALELALPESARTGVMAVPDFNNSRSHSEVIALFSRAIKRQRAIDAMGKVSTSFETSRAVAAATA